jgi:hypothetical protein
MYIHIHIYIYIYKYIYAYILLYVHTFINAYVEIVTDAVGNVILIGVGRDTSVDFIDFDDAFSSDEEESSWSRLIRGASWAVKDINWECSEWYWRGGGYKGGGGGGESPVYGEDWNKAEWLRLWEDRDNGIEGLEIG